MGFYYFIILFTGIILIFRAGLQASKHKSIAKKGILFLGVSGISLIGVSIFLFSPGSSDVIAELLKLN